MRRVLILGAAGRDFHNFNVLFRHNPNEQVVAFTATQVPNIAGRIYPYKLAGCMYPSGIPILDEKNLEGIIHDLKVDEAVFSYSDVSYDELMHLASRVLCTGADFRLVAPQRTQLISRVPVISVCAVRTGCGKSPVSRRVVRGLRRLGLHPVVVRHPMPYGDLVAQQCQRFSTLEDLDRKQCTLEEREENEQHIVDGTVVYAGVDYQAILSHAEQEADIIVWDGGNNDTCFFAPDLQIVVVDPLRAGHEVAYYPGEINLRSADVLIVNRVDSASQEQLARVHENIRRYASNARLIETVSRLSVRMPSEIAGKRVLVVEDGATLTHGGMPEGAGAAAARMHGAAELIDPRPYAVGSIADLYQQYPHLGPVLPAMGYGTQQTQELEETIARIPCDLVLVATPVELQKVIRIAQPSMRVFYDVEEVSPFNLTQVIEEFSHRCELNSEMSSMTTEAP